MRSSAAVTSAEVGRFRKTPHHCRFAAIEQESGERREESRRELAPPFSTRLRSPLCFLLTFRQLLGDLQLAERRAEELDLLDRVAHDIRKPIDRCWGLHECVIVDPAQPVSDRVVGDQEVATRFRFVPTTHGTSCSGSGCHSANRSSTSGRCRHSGVEELAAPWSAGWMGRGQACDHRIASPTRVRGRWIVRR